MSSQAFTVFVADQLEVGEHSREQEEQDMRQSWFSRNEIENMIRSGIVTDDSTIAAYLLYQLSDGNRAAD
jgi:8-oxo-dGDP phosphatase